MGHVIIQIICNFGKKKLLMTFLRCVIKCSDNLKVKTVLHFAGRQGGRRLALMQWSDIMVPSMISINFYTDTETMQLHCSVVLVFQKLFVLH